MCLCLVRKKGKLSQEERTLQTGWGGECVCVVVELRVIIIFFKDHKEGNSELIKALIMKGLLCYINELRSYPETVIYA